MTKYEVLAYRPMGSRRWFSPNRQRNGAGLDPADWLERFSRRALPLACVARNDRSSPAAHGVLPAPLQPKVWLDAVEQLGGRNSHGSGQLDDRAEPRFADGALQAADLGGVQAGGAAQVLLREAGFSALASDVATKDLMRLDHAEDGRLA